ncbi:hypothetical protein QMU90_003401 [Edwardsiella ictaluri]|uniref:hypothetical protein n=1 Tax=Edwardsiella ictaluri TaxID=67780 RepID=UPI000A61DB33|nr:hypothetical protein [Edwardsiella ictaluri]ELV7529455.1 hypothetical protein [Edwardsiella ictaluri]
MSSTEARALDKELSDCKASGGDCKSVVEKYIEISNKNSKELVDACSDGGVRCVTWEELIQGATNVANDAHPSQIRLDEKLKDPDAATLVNYLNGADLKFLQDNDGGRQKQQPEQQRGGRDNLRLQRRGV